MTTLESKLSSYHVGDIDVPSFIIDNMPDIPGTMLDYGSGEGRITFFFAEHGWKAIAVEKADRYVQSIRSNMFPKYRRLSPDSHKNVRAMSNEDFLRLSESPFGETPIIEDYLSQPALGIKKEPYLDLAINWRVLSRVVEMSETFGMPELEAIVKKTSASMKHDALFVGSLRSYKDRMAKRGEEVLMIKKGSFGEPDDMIFAGSGVMQSPHDIESLALRGYTKLMQGARSARKFSDYRDLPLGNTQRFPSIPRVYFKPEEIPNLFLRSGMVVEEITPFFEQSGHGWFNNLYYGIVARRDYSLDSRRPTPELKRMLNSLVHDVRAKTPEVLQAMYEDEHNLKIKHGFDDVHLKEYNSYLKRLDNKKSGKTQNLREELDLNRYGSPGYGAGPSLRISNRTTLG